MDGSTALGAAGAFFSFFPFFESGVFAEAVSAFESETVAIDVLPARRLATSFCHESLSATVRFSTTAPGLLSSSTTKKPTRSSWKRSPRFADARLGSAFALTTVSDA